MMAGLSSAIQGMQRAQQQFDSAASSIARAPFQTFSSNSSTSPSDNMDLSTAAINVLQSRNSFEANTRVAQVADEIQQSTISLLG